MGAMLQVRLEATPEFPCHSGTTTQVCTQLQGLDQLWWVAGSWLMSQKNARKVPLQSRKLLLCVCFFALVVFSALTGTLTTSPELQAIHKSHLSCGSGPPKFEPLSSFLPVSLWSSGLFWLWGPEGLLSVSLPSQPAFLTTQLHGWRGEWCCEKSTLGLCSSKWPCTSIQE